MRETRASPPSDAVQRTKQTVDRVPPMLTMTQNGLQPRAPVSASGGYQSSEHPATGRVGRTQHGARLE